MVVCSRRVRGGRVPWGYVGVEMMGDCRDGTRERQWRNSGALVSSVAVEPGHELIDRDVAARVAAARGVRAGGLAGDQAPAVLDQIAALGLVLLAGHALHEDF